MNEFWAEWRKCADSRLAMAPINALKSAHEKCPAALSNDITCKSVKEMLLYFGVNGMRDDDIEEPLIQIAGGLAAVIMVLEHDPSTIGLEQAIARTFPVGKNHMKVVDIALGCERSVTQFFRKRISCSCLDKRYAAVKSKPKSGLCDNCKQRKERTSLYVCSGCSAFQYCSVKCQSMQWSIHKSFCQEHPAG